MTEREQTARIDFNSRKMGLLEGSTKKAYNIDRLTVMLAFIIIIAGMAFSYLLISVGQVITGSIFGGVTIILAANSFLNFRKNFAKEKSKKE